MATRDHTPQRPIGSGFGARSTAADAAPTDQNSPSARTSGVEAHAIDRDAATRLWQLSARLTGVDAFAGQEK